MREKPGFPAHSRVSWEGWLNAGLRAGVEGIELTHSCSNRSPGATGLIWEYQKTFDARMSARRQNASSQRATQLDIIR
jgi:hypothetical protein